MDKKMDEKVILHWLQGIPFFKEFSAEELKNLASEEKRFLTFEKDQPIIREGETDKTLYVLLKGKAKATKKVSNQEIIITHLNEGAVFGAMYLISKKDRPYMLSSIPEERITVVALTPDYFKTLDTNLQLIIKQQLIEMVCTRLDHMVEKHANLMKEMLL